MNHKFILILIFFFAVNAAQAGNFSESIKTFSKKEITKLADAYVKNNVKVKNPVIVDADYDGDFDILNFTTNGNIEYYKNTGTPIL